MDRYIDKFNYLISNGYDSNIISKYFYVSDDAINKVVDNIFNDVTKNNFALDNPKCLIVGGQPGCGKSFYCNEFISKNSNYIYVNLDNYRVMHPYYDDIRNMIVKKWGSNDGTSEKSPNNDFTIITHYFAVKVNDLLLKRLCSKKFNVLLEWNLRYPEGPIEFTRKISDLNYTNDIVVVVTPRDVSYEACNLRYNIIKNFDRLVRRVPKCFHDLCVDSLPYSLEKIEKIGFRDDKFINNIKCILRDGTVIWESGMDNISFILNKYLNSKFKFVDNDVKYVKMMYKLENSRK